MPEPEDEAFLLTRDYDDGKGTIKLTVDASYRVRLVLRGKGTMPGTLAFLKMLDESIRELDQDHKKAVSIDLRGLSGSPVRAQFILGKWLFKNKSNVAGLAIFGGKAWEMKLARLVVKIARLHGVGFFDTEPQAISFLGWDKP